MAICLLARHGSHDVLDRILVGRSRHVGLNERGRAEAQALARRAVRLDVTHVQSSPQRRAIETAQPVAERLGLETEICPALDEVDFGAWAGRAFDELEEDYRWRRWNGQRSAGQAPGGESMREAQARIVDHLRRLHANSSGARILMVTHAEIIRAAALTMSGLSLDSWQQIDVPPGSITRIELRPDRHALVRIAGAA